MDETLLEYADCRGLALGVEPAGIVLESESKWFGIIGGGVKEVRLPIGEILECKVQEGNLQARFQDRHSHKDVCYAGHSAE